MSQANYFLLESVARIGSSIFAGTLVSCLILNRLEWLHIILMASGLCLMSCGYFIAPKVIVPRNE